MLNYIICKTQVPFELQPDFFFIIINFEIHEICYLTKLAHLGLILSLSRILGHWRLIHSEDKTPCLVMPSSVPCSHIHPKSSSSPSAKLLKELV